MHPPSILVARVTTVVRQPGHHICSVFVRREYGIEHLGHSSIDDDQGQALELRHRLHLERRQAQGAHTRQLSIAQQLERQMPALSRLALASRVLGAEAEYARLQSLEDVVMIPKATRLRRAAPGAREAVVGVWCINTPRDASVATSMTSGLLQTSLTGMLLAVHREQCQTARSWPPTGKILAVIVGSPVCPGQARSGYARGAAARPVSRLVLTIDDLTSYTQNDS
jgi:hypothetical protein